jgi:hypothetical protein
VDLDSIALVESKDLVDRWLKERFLDALFSASFRGVPGYIWFLVEHQSEPERFMVLRVLEYLVRSWRELLRLVTEYVTFYNRARPSQATGTIPDPYDELRKPPSDAGRVVAIPILGGVQKDYRRAA